MKIAGFDIGGATTDLAIVDFNNEGEITSITTDYQYLPMWKNKEKLPQTLKKLLGTYLNEINAIGVCMTAELADAYQTKNEGVIDITNKVKKDFNQSIGYVGLNGIINDKQLQDNPSQVAAANWIATSNIAAQINPNAIMIDTGSTTTDIIPIKNGVECAQGRSDLQRLQTGELVYTGTLRTNIATFTDKVPLDDTWMRLASELFAISADIHIILGNIKQDDYICDTPDGSGKTREDCMRRIARVICGDMTSLSPQDITRISEYIYKKQVNQVIDALKQVSSSTGLSEVVTTGLGMDIIGSKASEEAELHSTGMNEILSREECIVAPAIGTAILMEKYLRK